MARIISLFIERIIIGVFKYWNIRSKNKWSLKSLYI